MKLTRGSSQSAGNDVWLERRLGIRARHSVIRAMVSQHWHQKKHGSSHLIGGAK